MVSSLHRFLWNHGNKRMERRARWLAEFRQMERCHRRLAGALRQRREQAALVSRGAFQRDVHSGGRWLVLGTADWIGSQNAAHLRLPRVLRLSLLRNSRRPLLWLDA